jgi:hypothetical protein
MAPTPEQLALANRYLPEAAKLAIVDGGYGWDDAYIIALMTENAYRPAQAVRYFWYQRVQETAEYLDLSKPLTQIHEQARKMLDYWDLVLQTNTDPDGMEPLDPDVNPNAHKMITFGDIERPWAV